MADGNAFDPGVLDVVAEADGLPVAGGVVEDSLLGDACEGNASVDLQRRPGKRPALIWSGKIFGSPAALKTSCAIYTGDLVVAMAVGDVAGEDGGDDQRARHADGADDVSRERDRGPSS